MQEGRSLLSVVEPNVPISNAPLLEGAIVDGRHAKFLFVPLCRQSTSYTCGVASLQSILMYYGHDYREDDLAEQLKSDEEEGTRPQRIVDFAKNLGVGVEWREQLTLADVHRYIDEGKPLLVAYQAWAAWDPVQPDYNYEEQWEDGHYSILCGYDEKNLYFMDPSTLGTYTYLPNDTFLKRWHDYYHKEETGESIRLHQFGVAFSGQVKYRRNAVTFIG